MITFPIDTSKVWNCISKPLGYLSNPESKIRHLTEAMQQLEAIGNDVKNRVSSHELGGETCLQHVRLLLDSVPSIKETVTRIERDYEQNRCLCGYTINFLCINWRATHKLARVVDLREQINKLEVVTTMLPPPPVQELPQRSTFLGMEPKLNEVLRYLNDDHVGIIGIWGMGGVGKTSLLKSINNNFLGGPTSAMFDHVIWAAVSKEYTVNKLQNEICGRLFQKETDSRLGMRPLDNKWENVPEHEKATTIFNRLKCRNFLLLLDDLWNDF